MQQTADPPKTDMKKKVRFLLHFTMGLFTVLKPSKRYKREGPAQLVLNAEPVHLNRYLLNAVLHLKDRVTVQVEASPRNLVSIGELKRSGRLGAELLECPQITFRRERTANISLSIDYFQEQFDNRLPIWGHPKFNETWVRDTIKTTQVVFAGSHRSAYRGFNESLWSMPNRIEQVEFIAKHIPDIAVYEWIASNREYARLLSKSSHFLCLPGYRMPLCHNFYEAIHFGCVPIVHTSYHKWLEPNLRNAIQPFTYSTMDALQMLVDRIQSGKLDAETHSTQLKIQNWIESDYELDLILKEALAKGEIILCAEEASVAIHENRIA